MRILSHPLRLDSSGAIVTIDDGSDRHAAELAGVIAATGIGERGLAPEYGLSDPSGSSVSPDVVAAAISRCEPELTVTSVDVDPLTSQTATVRLSVTWAE